MIPFFTFFAVITMILLGYAGFVILQRKSKGPHYTKGEKMLMVIALQEARDKHTAESEALREAGFQDVDLTPTYDRLINKFN